MHAPQPHLTYPQPTPPAPGTVSEIAPGILWLRLALPFLLDHVNIYLIADDDGWERQRHRHGGANGARQRAVGNHDRLRGAHVDRDAPVREREHRSRGAGRRRALRPCGSGDNRRLATATAGLAAGVGALVALIFIGAQNEFLYFQF